MARAISRHISPITMPMAAALPTCGFSKAARYSATAGVRVEVPGPAAGGHPDQVEGAQGPGDRERERDGELGPQAGQGDGEELPDRAGAVHLGRLVELGGNLGDPGDEQHHAEAEGDPGADHAERGQCPGEVTEPAAGEGVESDGAQQGVQGTLGPVDALEDERDDDAGEHLRQEVHEAVDSHAGQLPPRDQRP